MFIKFKIIILYIIHKIIVKINLIIFYNLHTKYNY